MNKVLGKREFSAIRRVLSRFPVVRLAYLYGSSLQRADFRDVDIALGTTPGYPGDSIGLRLKFAATLGRSLPWEFDVHLLHELPLPLQHRVISTGRCLLARDEIARVRFEAGVLNEFLDFEPTHSWLVDAAIQRAARL